MSFRRPIWIWFLFFFGIFSIHPLFTKFAPRANSSGLAVPGEIVLKMALNQMGILSDQQVNTLISGVLGQGVVESTHPFKTDSKLKLLKLSNSSSSVQDAIAKLNQAAFVRYAEPNFIYHTDDSVRLPNDPMLDQLWGLKNDNGDDINVVPAWQQGVTGSKDVVVAVVDTGMDWNHPDLADNLYTNPSSDDGTGFTGDIHGWNFIDNDPQSNAGDTTHGTHVSGTIGAVGNNGIGIVGVNWHVSLMPVKVLDGDSGTLENAVNGINYARMMKVDMMSNSWGANIMSQALSDAIKQTQDAGILFVAAAGNDGADISTSPHYPAAYPYDNIVAVGAIDSQYNLASFSNFGSGVHVAAPGVNILSTIPGNQYKALNGTSMATPHVTGVAALMLSKDHQLSYQEIKNRLIQTSTPVSGLQSSIVAKGVVNAYNAVNNIVPSGLPRGNMTHNSNAEGAHPRQ